MTPEYAVQASDRRLTDIDGTVRERPENKAVFYRGFSSFSYTGLATIAGVPTYEWLMEQLGAARDLGDAFERVPAAATAAIAKIRFPGLPSEQQRRVIRRLAFVGVGFLATRVAPDSLEPFVAVISNFFDVQHGWTNQASHEVRCEVLGIGYGKPFLLLPAGAGLLRDERVRMYRSLKRCLARSGSPWPVARILSRAVREVSLRQRNRGFPPTVGLNVMCTLVPRPAWRSGERIEIAFSGDTLPLQGAASELDKFTPPTPGGQERRNFYVYWPGDGEAFPHLGPGAVIGGHLVKELQLAPAGLVKSASPERAGDVPARPPRRALP